MKAMVLAAGLGTRLRSLTNDRPKALVELNGRTLLEITLARLRAAGVTDVIVNTHHFADRVADFLRSRDFGLRVALSYEPVLLDTGGGLKNAAWFFDDGQPFLLHNTDVLTDIDLSAMLRAHREQNALAILATQNRSTSRPLLFDPNAELCGRIVAGGQREMVRAVENPDPRAFNGIHVLSPRIFDLLTEEGVFSIIPAYLRLAAAGESIRAFAADAFYWRDLGRPEHLEQAAADIASGLCRI
ncbi:nucleotidyltransferase family protein [Acidobacteria bacterium AB60]|nr:nucleotidyltransferase family protein [Acidobacteria bacterium AB60]